MGPEQREWKTEGEIVGIIHGIVDTKISDVHQEMRDAMRDQKQLLEKIADGAQASMNSATLLHGDRAHGIEGFVPEVRRRLKSVEENQDKDREADRERDNRLQRLEEGQNRIYRFLVRICKAIVKDKDGEIDYKRIAVIMMAVASVVNLLTSHIPSSYDVKRFFATFAQTVSK